MRSIQRVVWRLRDRLPDWGPVRWTAVGLACLVLVLTGISLFHTPAREVVYSVSRFEVPSGEGDRLWFVTIELGNTGSLPQGDVRVRFRQDPVTRSVIAPSARNFGVSERPVVVSKNGQVATLSLGRIDPGKRVRLTVCLTFPRGSEIPAWEELFLGVEPEKGKARAGDPGMTQVGRAWFSLFTDWLPL